MNRFPRRWHGRLFRPSLANKSLEFEALEPRLALSSYPLVNAGFESPELSLENSWSPTVQGWDINAGAPGVTYEVPFAEPSPAPEGDQYLFGDSDRWIIRQAGPTIEANTRYLLSVDLFPLSTGTTSAGLTLQDSAFAQLDSQVFQPFWAPDRQDFELPDGQWTTVTIGWNSAELPTSVGNALSIVIEGSRLAVDNVRVTVDASTHDFFFSSTTGSYRGDGFSPASAWNDFDALAPYLPLQPGERILLKAGDTFTEELNLRGKGTADNLVELTSYGTGDNPVIRRSDLKHDVGVVWNNASHARISNIDVEHSKLGIYLRYEWEDVGSQNVTIENSNFRDMTDPSLDASANNFEYAWSDAIWVGGQAWNQAEFSTRLDGLTIRNVTAENVAHLFGTGWYFPAPYMSRLTNLLIEDSVAINALAGSFQLFGVDGGIIRRVKATGGGGQDTWSGTTLGFIQDSKNVLIEDNEFSFIDRAQSADGSGMDFEGNTENVTFRNNTIHNNAGSALLILSTGGPNKNLVIEDNTFYNNALDPWNSEINSEIQGSADDHTGVIRNNGIYRGDASINFLSPNSDWSGFVISGNRQEEYGSVRERPSWWEFDTDGDFQGWGGFNQWASASVEGGLLTGTSSGVDAYVHSAETWVNTNEADQAWVRMSSTAGSVAQVFYITETDPVWNQEKSAFFQVTPDGELRDYFVDLNQTDLSGVITQVRLDPTTVADSEVAVDFLRLTGSTDPNQPPLPQPGPPPLEMPFTSIASQDGHVLESAKDSGQGGFTSANSSTFRLGDDAQNRAYRKVLSFDTSSLPDNAIVVEATIGITRVGNPVGQIPIGVANSFFGDILVDIATPGFGATNSLTISDWQNPATQEAVSKFAWPAYLDGQTLFSRLDDQHNDLVNLTGPTQFRVRYENDDDGDNTADYMSYATSNHFNPSFRPQLVVKYYLPDGAGAGQVVSSAIEASTAAEPATLAAPLFVRQRSGDASELVSGGFAAPLLTGESAAAARDEAMLLVYALPPMTTEVVFESESAPSLGDAESGAAAREDQLGDAELDEAFGAIGGGF
ncbi:MAG: right-handed parallel beta-helix repeat-containing protein [Planctomycetota bacterium]